MHQVQGERLLRSRADRGSLPPCKGSGLPSYFVSHNLIVHLPSSSSLTVSARERKRAWNWERESGNRFLSPSPLSLSLLGAYSHVSTETGFTCHDDREKRSSYSYSFSFFIKIHSFIKSVHLSSLIHSFRFFPISYILSRGPGCNKVR